MSKAKLDHEAIQRAGRWAAIRWGSFVVGMLGFQVALGVFAITVATSDPTVAVVPDYYARSLEWDETQRLKRESEQLGWTVRLVDSQQPKFPGAKAIEVRDSENRLVPLASGTVILYRHARASQPLEVKLSATVNGVIQIPKPLNHPGLWELELDLESKQGERFLYSESMQLSGVVLIDNGGRS